MRHMLFGFMIVLVISLVLYACNSHTELPTDPQKLIQDGQPIYVQYCASCHQQDGSGKPGKVPKLAGNPVVTLEDPIPVIDIVVNGKGSMQGFSDQLGSDQIASVISYIRNAWGNQATAVDQRQIP